jgi:hypothetical protein
MSTEVAVMNTENVAIAAMNTIEVMTAGITVKI